MAYVVDVTIIMQIIFWHMRQQGGIHPVSSEVVSFAFAEHEKSNLKKTVHKDIREYVDGTSVSGRMDPDLAVEKITSLISDHCTELEDMYGPGVVTARNAT